MLRVNWNPATFNTIKICIEFMKFTIFSNFQFRVSKKYMSGLPYLKKPSWNYFKIGVILWNMVPKYENKCKISWEHDTRTFSFQALCASWSFLKQPSNNFGPCYHVHFKLIVIGAGFNTSDSLLLCCSLMAVPHSLHSLRRSVTPGPVAWPGARTFLLVTFNPRQARGYA